MTHNGELKEFHASVLCAPAEVSHCGRMNVRPLVEYVSRRKCAEWIPQSCLCVCVSVGFNEGFTAAASRRPTETQPSQLQGVALLLGPKLRPNTQQFERGKKKINFVF